MVSFGFLQAADIHLDSPLHGLSRYDGLPADEVSGATRAALDNLVHHAIDERFDFVLIAGELFDGDWRDMGTGLHFARAMGRLDQAGKQPVLNGISLLQRSVPPPLDYRLYRLTSRSRFDRQSHRRCATAPKTIRVGGQVCRSDRGSRC